MKKIFLYISAFFLNSIMSLFYWFWLFAYNLAMGLDDFTYPSREAYIYSPAEDYYGLYIFVFVYVAVVIFLNMMIVNNWIYKNYEYEFSIIIYMIIAILGFNFMPVPTLINIYL